MKYPVTLSLCFFLAACGSTRAQGPATNYTISQIPNYEGSQAYAINNRGQILIPTAQGGYFHDDIYSLETNTLTSVPVPSAALVNARGFNNLDDVVFRGITNGQIIVAPGITGVPITITIEDTGNFQVNPSGINDAGAIIGYASSVYSPYSEYSFLYQQGVITKIVFPGSAPNTTYASAINDAGAVVGTYQDAQGNAHGMLYQNGVYRTIEVPQTKSTSITGINNLGQMVGKYVGLLGVTRSWVYSNGKFFTLSQFGGAFALIPEGINDEGQILIVGALLTPSTFTGF